MDVIELHPSPSTSPTKRKRIGSTDKKDEQASAEPCPHRGSVGVQASPLRITVNIAEDIKLRECLVDAMTRAQETQARACSNLLVLTDTLHDWARDLDGQERWLREERRRLIEQQQALTKTQLEIAAGCIKQRNKSDHSKKPDNVTKLPDTEDTQQFKKMIAVLEGNIEVLISQLQIEKETCKAAEDRLRAREGSIKSIWADTDDSSTPSP